ncbi:MAG: class I SAM-dependent methyltransferase, partial [Candidatus Methanoperedens sp.]|nr:class I SAM-dependent methyltransferase [Candidatus Methanoperedens sp.]
MAENIWKNLTKVKKMIISSMRHRARQNYKNVMTSSISEYQKKRKTTEIKVLDVGAGNCWLLNLLPDDYTKVGIDLHTHDHFINTTFIDFQNAKSSHFVFGDATTLPFKDATFDVVYSNEFVSHVKDIDETLKEQMRVLQKDGILLIMDANPLNIETFFSCFIINYLHLGQMTHGINPAKLNLPKVMTLYSEELDRMGKKTPEQMLRVELEN